jgi:hypothetical protein
MLRCERIGLFGSPINVAHIDRYRQKNTDWIAPSAWEMSTPAPCWGSLWSDRPAPKLYAAKFQCFRRAGSTGSSANVAWARVPQRPRCTCPEKLWNTCAKSFLASDSQSKRRRNALHTRAIPTPEFNLYVARPAPCNSRHNTHYLVNTSRL